MIDAIKSCKSMEILNKDEQYINQQNYEEMKRKQFYLEQQQEFTKMLKVLNDFMDSASKIAPQYQ